MAMINTRDDFPNLTKLVLAQRAGYRCSLCKKLTIGPHSNPEKSLSTGIAAHIYAATSGGPRYNANQTPCERKAISNGIWVCHSCSDLIDKDANSYSPDSLQEQKIQHENWIAGRQTTPAPPIIDLENIIGTPLPKEALNYLPAA